ncbi:unnamed protein product [Nippostrongylus brasiliensis]|uniref:ANK_REP_REGION domain-containing protein n=1 Tax=Nippostrongylus brasiliensis TaxID=27835 RepID=A0A158QXS2_NIPBR|nr:unnamed protein product [Nippostrongylus brasiliensis]
MQRPEIGADAARPGTVAAMSVRDRVVDDAQADRTTVRSVSSANMSTISVGFGEKYRCLPCGYGRPMVIVSRPTQTGPVTPLTTVGNENSIKCTKNPREPRRTSNPECSTKGPNSDQLAWIRACRKGDIQACKTLLYADPDILHYVAPLHLDYSAVHIATLGRHYELMRLLKSRGANFNAQTKSGYTPLHLAAQNQNRDMVRTLISEFGVDTRILDLHGYRYEYYADWLDYPEYDDLSCRTICSGGNMAGSSRQPSIGSQESLASSKNSFSRHGSIRETVRGLLHIPTRTRISRSPSPNPIAV